MPSFREKPTMYYHDFPAIAFSAETAFGRYRKQSDKPNWEYFHPEKRDP